MTRAGCVAWAASIAWPWTAADGDPLLKHHIQSFFPDAGDEMRSLMSLCRQIVQRSGMYGSVQKQLARAVRLRRRPSRLEPLRVRQTRPQGLIARLRTGRSEGGRMKERKSKHPLSVAEMREKAVDPKTPARERKALGRKLVKLTEAGQPRPRRLPALFR